MPSLSELAAMGLATYALAVWLTTKLGPWGLFQRGRAWALQRRGFVLYTRGQLVDEGVLPLDVINDLTARTGSALIRKTPEAWTVPQNDWLAAGLSCPTCASLTVGAVVVALSWASGLLVVPLAGLPLAILAAAGLSTLLNETIGALR